MPNVPMLLISASATVTIRKEIERMLGLVETVLVADTFNRPNLAYFVKRKSKESPDEIANKIKSQKCALIYCSKHEDVEYVASFLRSKNVSCRFYHAGLNSQLKEKLHNEWKESKLVSLACTTAFGMGIDKPDVRLVVHYGLPHSLKDYYQETGMAGRDGMPVECHMFCDPADQNHIVKGIHESFAKSSQNIDYRELTNSMKISRFDEVRFHELFLSKKSASEILRGHGKTRV